MTTLATARIALALVALVTFTSCGGDTTPDMATTDAPTTSQDSEVAETSAGTSVVESDGPDLTAFYDGALVGDVATVDCTLDSGTTASCYELTIAGFPATRDSIGPWCPSTTSDTAEEVGIWFDGDSVYDVDGQFILDLAEIYGDPNWMLYDENGNVFSTDTAEFFNEVAGPDNFTSETPEEYQNLCVYGEIEWVEGGEPITSTHEIPVTPTMATSPTQPGATLGITLDGVRIEGSAPVEFILGNYTIGVFDDCGGHVNPVDGYHMHATTGCSDSGVEIPDGETALFGYALDGYGIRAPYGAGSDSEADLDQCNGHETAELEYHYHSSSVAENQILPCFSGETAGSGGGQPVRPGG